mmetsp:Transcript_13018/g.24857  ORF Transcript_13018/g.24857 Transcript_13018/m.24857 type:complete len:234 (-) Transcript_13018:352-1053(-)
MLGTKARVSATGSVFVVVGRKDCSAKNTLLYSFTRNCSSSRHSCFSRLLKNHCGVTICFPHSLAYWYFSPLVLIASRWVHSSLRSSVLNLAPFEVQLASILDRSAVSSPVQQMTRPVKGLRRKGAHDTSLLAVWHAHTQSSDTTWMPHSRACRYLGTFTLAATSTVGPWLSLATSSINGSIPTVSSSLRLFSEYTPVIAIFTASEILVLTSMTWCGEDKDQSVLVFGAGRCCI